MAHSFRQSSILDIAQREGRVMVEDLAERLSVTQQTIRRDLTELAEAGKVERVHGGAIFASGVTNFGYEERRGLNEAAKTRIAAACVADIPDGASLFLNIGTSTEAVARALMGHKNLMVVTNNMNVANILAENPECEVIVAGGTLRRSDGGLVGNLTMRTIEQFKFDIAVIGCSALDSEGDLLDFDVQEVGVSQTIIARSRKVFLAVDHSKFSRAAPVRIASLQDVDRCYTDEPFAPDLHAACQTWGTQVVVAPAR